MKVILKNVRLSFPDLQHATQYQGKGPFNYGATFLVPTGSALAKEIDAAIKTVATEKWPKKAEAYLKEIMPDKKACCWIDGDRREYDGYAGNWSLAAKRKQDKGPPMVLDADRSPIFKEDRGYYPGKEGRIYAGCYVNASVEIYAQDNDSGRGIRCELLGVQFFRDGDSFGGGTPPSADDFEDVAAGADADSLV